MLGSCIIDRQDIGAWGMFILRGGDYDFLSFPERKTPDLNNWHEVDGVDADLSEVFFKEKQVTVRFYISGDNGESYFNNLSSFYELISVPGSRQLYSREFQKTFTLRFLSCEDYMHIGGMYKSGKKRGELEVAFSMDDPLLLFPDTESLTPRNGRSKPAQVKINGIDLSEFGIIVNQCYNTVLRLANPKPPLTRSFSKANGILAYTPARTTFEVKQITIDCTMTAQSLDDFYFNYGVLFNHMRATGVIEIGNYSGNDLCYYSSMTDFEKLSPFSRRILVKFSLNFICLTTGVVTRVLATQDFNPVTPEGEEALIPIGAYKDNNN